MINGVKPIFTTQSTKNIKKIYTRLIVFVGICASTVMASATTYRSIVFNKTDGEKFTCTVESGMTTFIRDGFITISSDKGALSIATSEVSGWTFSTEPGASLGDTGIKSTAFEDNAVELVVNADCMTLSGLAPGSNVMLVGIDGLVLTSTAAEGTLRIPTSQLNAGVYILSYNDKSIKIALK